MITSLGKHALSVTTVLAVGGLSLVAGQVHAKASGFSAAYTCNISNMGQTPAVLTGWLSSPGTSYVGPGRFRLHITSMNLQAPLPIQSWSATAWINVSGAENSTFQVSGSGGTVPMQGAIAGDLVGSWAPVMGGIDTLSVGGIEITANSAEAGSVPVQCVPNGAPVADVLRVVSPYHGHWNRPVVPGFHIGGWYRPGMTLHRPVWARPGRPGGWNRPGVPGHPGGWNRPGAPGGWNRPDAPGGWNHPGAPGGWNHPGAPVHPGHPGGPIHHDGPHHH